MVDPELISILNSMKDQIISVNDRINSMDDKMNSMSNDIAEIKDKVNSIDERVTSLENVLTIIEHEHGNKLDILLDHAKANIEKHYQFESIFTKIEEKFLNHDIRLANIESSEEYKRVINAKRDYIKEHLYDKYLETDKNNLA